MRGSAGRGFGSSVKSRGPEKRSAADRSRPPNSFSSMGRAVRHRSKFGNVPVELGLLDMSNQLRRRHETIQNQYEGAKPYVAGAGRQRGAQKHAAYQALSAYSLHFLKLLEEELLYEEAEVMQRLWHWGRGRLQEEGLAIFGVVARPRGRLYKEWILRFTLPASKKSRPSWSQKGSSSNSVRAPPLRYHRLGPGDIISITLDRQNPLTSSQVLEGLVLERGSFYVDVVVKEIPPGVQWRKGDPTVGERFRLDLYMNRISFQRMVAAIHQVTGLETGYTVSPEIREILVKSFVERFDLVFPSHHHVNKPYTTAPSSHVQQRPHVPQYQHQLRRDTTVLNLSPYTVGQPKPLGDKSWNRRENAAEETRPVKARRRKQWRSETLKETNWETMASAVPKLHYPRKDTDRLITDEVKQNGLNPSQDAAMRMALSRKLSLIQGPPGTGKTRTACHLIRTAVRLAERRDTGKVLAVAFSNVAADNLLEGCLRLGLQAVRIGRPATVRPELRNFTLDAMLTKHDSVVTFKRRLEDARGRAPKDLAMARRDLDDAELVAAISVLGNADVVVSTCVGAGNEAIVTAASATAAQGSKGALRAVRFPTVVVDEASQATEPATLVPLTQGCEQLVLVGDHYQLPPTIKSTRAAQQGLGVSMFTRLALAGIQPSLLTMQYRMHPMIADFPSWRFYGGLLKSSSGTRKHRSRPEGFPWPAPTIPVAFVAVGEESDRTFFEQRTNGNQTSYMNRKEAEIVVDIMQVMMQRTPLQVEDMGIVTPYSAQVKHITEHMQQRIRPAAQLSGLEIHSVDAYQGREKELIVISAVRSNRAGKVGFLADWRRLNVAITRAKSGIVVVGDVRTLIHDPHWGAYIRWCAKHNCILPVGHLREAFRKGGMGVWRSGRRARGTMERDVSDKEEMVYIRTESDQRGPSSS